MYKHVAKRKSRLEASRRARIRSMASATMTTANTGNSTREDHDKDAIAIAVSTIFKYGVVGPSWIRRTARDTCCSRFVSRLAGGFYILQPRIVLSVAIAPGPIGGFSSRLPNCEVRPPSRWVANESK